MTHERSATILVLAAAAWAGVGADAGAPPRYTVTHIAPVTGDVGSRPFSLGAGGSVVGSSVGGLDEHAYVWTGRMAQALPSLGGFELSNARGVNAQGVIVGESAISGFQTIAALWTPASEGWDVLELGTQPGFIFSRAEGINDRGDLIVGCVDVDYLDFASPISGLGSKMGFDATNKWPAETNRPWGKPIEMDPQVKQRINAIWDSII